MANDTCNDADANDEGDAMPTVYIGHTSKSDKQLLIGTSSVSAVSSYTMTPMPWCKHQWQYHKKHLHRPHIKTG